MRSQPITLIAAAMATFVALSPAAPATAAERSGGSGKIVPIDRIIAVVNDEVLTQKELEDRLEIVTQQLKAQGTPLPPRNVLERQLLERMINDRVQLHFAKQTGIRVDDNQLDRTLQRIAQQNNLSLPDFKAALERDGIKFSKFREEIRDEIILSRLREREVDNKVNVTEAEIDAYLDSQGQQNGQQQEYRLAHILIRVPEQARPEQIQEKRAKAQKALDELKNGAPFAQVSAAYSDAPNALEGGSIGWRNPGQIPSLFAEALKSMKPGQTSGLLQSPNGFHIVKLEEVRGADQQMVVQQTHARHILVKTNELVSEADAKHRLVQLKERIQNGADFAELARLHSDDASAARGGDLGWLSPGDTVPEFERAMDALKPGQLSDPVQSPFGWHLIQVLERRKEDVTQERQRLLARQAIKNRKADEAYQDFVRQLRDQAYVDYRTEER